MKENEQDHFFSNRLLRFYKDLSHSEGEFKNLSMAVLNDVSTSLQEQFKADQWVDPLNVDLMVLQKVLNLFPEPSKISSDLFSVFHNFSRETLRSYGEGLVAYEKFAEGDYQQQVRDALRSNLEFQDIFENLATAMARGDFQEISNGLTQLSEQNETWKKARDKLVKHPEGLKHVMETVQKEVEQQQSYSFQIQTLRSDVNRLLTTTPTSPESIQCLKKVSAQILELKDKEKLKKQSERFEKFKGVENSLSIAHHLINAVRPWAGAEEQEYIHQIDTAVAYAQGSLKISMGIALAFGVIAIPGAGPLYAGVLMAEGVSILSNLAAGPRPTEGEMTRKLIRIAVEALNETIHKGFERTEMLLRTMDQSAQKRYLHMLQYLQNIVKETRINLQISQKIQQTLLELRTQIHGEHVELYEQNYSEKIEIIRNDLKSEQLRKPKINRYFQDLHGRIVNKIRKPILAGSSAPNEVVPEQLLKNIDDSFQWLINFANQFFKQQSLAKPFPRVSLWAQSINDLVHFLYSVPELEHNNQQHAQLTEVLEDARNIQEQVIRIRTSTSFFTDLFQHYVAAFHQVCDSGTWVTLRTAHG